MGRNSMTKAPVFVGLLRGVNVGGNNIISMSSLKRALRSWVSAT